MARRTFEPDCWQGEPANREPAKCARLVWADPERLPPDVVEYTAAILALSGAGSRSP